MSEIVPHRRGVPAPPLTLEDAYDLLADPIRRATVRVVRRSQQPVTLEKLAARVASHIEDAAESPGLQSTAEVRLRLAHVHLPKLTIAGVVRSSQNGLLGATTGSTVLDQILDGIDGNVITDDHSIDRLFEALANRRRRLVLSLLADGAGPRTRAKLAETVARERQGSDGAASEGAAVKQIRSRLVHVDLPKLRDAGLITFGAPDEPVDYRGHPLIAGLPLWSP